MLQQECGRGRSNGSEYCLLLHWVLLEKMVCSVFVSFMFIPDAAVQNYWLLYRKFTLYRGKPLGLLGF